MPAQKPLVTDAGTTQRLQAADQLEVNAGSAALPSLTIASDPNTGLFSPGADQLAIATGGTQRMVVNASGNVGIGVTPTSTFSVGASGTERFRVDGATGRIVEYSDSVPANGEVLIGNGTNFAKSTLTAGTNIGVTNGAGSITVGLTGTVGVTNGGTGTSTAFTAGSVVFAGPSGVYAQDNDNLFWDDTTNRLAIGFVPVVTFSGNLTITSTTIALTTTAACNVQVSFDLLVPSGTVVIDTDTAALVVARYGSSVTGNTLASSLQATTAILTATATVGGVLTLPGGFYQTTTVGSSSRTLSSTLNVGTTGQFQVSSAGDIVAIRGQTTTFPAVNASGVLTNDGSGTLSWTAPVSVANGGTGQSTYTNGQLLIGNTTGNTLTKATLTAGTGIAITNGAGSITIAASNAAGVQPITTISTATTLGSTNYTVLCNGTFTVSLPAAASNTGRIYNIKNIGVGTITVDPNAAETIDGAATYTLSTQYESITIQCNGTAWFIL
jgi:hypothetical protein